MSAKMLVFFVTDQSTPALPPGFFHTKNTLLLEPLQTFSALPGSAGLEGNGYRLQQKSPSDRSIIQFCFAFIIHFKSVAIKSFQYIWSVYQCKTLFFVPFSNFHILNSILCTTKIDISIFSLLPVWHIKAHSSYTILNIFAGLI